MCETLNCRSRVLQGKKEWTDLVDDDFTYYARQKVVDTKIGLDIALLSEKKLVDQVVLIAGDSDFVPAAKHARREGVDFILEQVKPEPVLFKYTLSHLTSKSERSEMMGMDALFVHLCQKYKCALIPVRNERIGSAEFKLTVCQPLPLFDEQDTPLPVEDVIANAHELLESCISERPGEWLWLHRRWSDVGQQPAKAA